MEMVDTPENELTKWPFKSPDLYRMEENYIFRYFYGNKDQTRRPMQHKPKTMKKCNPDNHGSTICQLVQVKLKLLHC